MSGGYKDFVAGAVLTAADLEQYCELQGIMKFASAAARTTALSGVLEEGLFSFLLDTNVLQVYSGSAWSTVAVGHGALLTWTPAIVQSGAVTCTVTYADYQRVGRMITGQFHVAITGGAGVSSNAITISLPVTAKGSSASYHIGSGSIFDASASLRYWGEFTLASSTTMNLSNSQTTTNGALYGVVGFTAALAASDTISGQFHYEAAGDA
jgi:hypothetical protein